MLAFRLQETKIVVSAKRAVFELSQQDEEIERGDIGKLALIAAENDFRRPQTSRISLRRLCPRTTPIC